jgi:hypothetical protein
MKTSDLLRHRIIKNIMATHTEKVADSAIYLWEQMAAKIISIIGESGFNSLYARSVTLTQSTFPWLASREMSFQTDDHRFAELRISFEKQASEQISEANCLILITFTDILASLIGEQLTASILRSAWGNDASNIAGKEIQND